MTTKDESQNVSARKVLLSLAPTILAILVMAGGWVYNYATTAATLREHDRRLVTIEVNYVPKAVHEAKDASLAEQELETRERLDRIETKLDQLTVILLDEDKARVVRSGKRDGDE